MGLVDYNSDSDSGSDAEAPTPSTAPTAKKPFQKLVDRANPGKIVVNLPTATTDATGSAEDGAPPAKRAKVGGGGRFSGFGSFLPPPKKTSATPKDIRDARDTDAKDTKDTTTESSISPPPKRPAVHFKTSAEAAFARHDDSVLDASSSTSFVQTQPPAKAPSIPRDQKAAGDVKLVGNPLMFMPLSISRKPVKKKVVSAASGGSAGAKRAQEEVVSEPAEKTEKTEKPEKRKKVSLFSIGVDTPEPAPEPGVEDDDKQATDYTSTYSAVPAVYGYDTTAESTPAPAPSADASLSTFADDMQLSAKERRELFGRTGTASTAQISATFDMDAEYRQNEQMRQSGEADAQLQARNKVRTLMPGKHSLKQLVDQVHTQKDVLEETFAKNRESQRQSGGRYGWR